MNSRKTLKSVSVDGLKPTIMLTPVIELRGEGYRIHHIKSFSIAPDGRDTFVPLRHVSKQKRRIFELEEENAKLRELVRDYDKCLDTALYLAGNAGYPCMPDSGLFSSLHPRTHELGIEVIE